MIKLLGTIALAFSLAGPALAIQSWTAHGPGGGGNFTSVDVSSSGRVLVGGDVSGAYARNGNTGDWTRIGTLDGIVATRILTARFSPANPSRALCGTGNGLYLSSNSGQTWSETGDSLMSTDDVNAVGWGRGADSLYAFVAWPEGTGITGSIKAARTTDGGANWTPVTDINEDSSGTANPIKVVVDPHTTGSTRRIYVLTGVSSATTRTTRMLWRTEDNGSSWQRITHVSATPVYPIDIVVHPDTAGIFLMATSDSTDATINKTGTLYRNANGTWYPMTLDGTYKPTGAVWYDGSVPHMLTVYEDACGLATNDAAGRWKVVSGAWSRVDNGRDGPDGDAVDPWEFGWIDGVNNCDAARGQTISNVALSVSAKGEYWVTASFVWHYSTSGADKYVNVFTDDETSPWLTKKIDNANPVTIELDGSTPWVGYYDLGLWKYTSTGWENRNDSEWGWNGDGGNVNGIIIEGSTMYVTAAPSSKGNDWKLYRSTNSGAHDSWSTVGNLPTKGQEGFPTVFLNSLMKDPAGASPKYWLTVNGRVWSASSATGTWTQESNATLPDTGIMVVRAYGGTVLAGGWSGLFRSGDNGATWSRCTTITKPTPAASLPAERNDPINSAPALHKRVWYGIQQIVFDGVGAKWYVVCYAPAGGLTSGSKGVWSSTDHGQTFAVLGGAGSAADSVQRRGVAADSCGARIHITSGEAFSSGPNSNSTIQRATGKQTCRFSSGSLVCVPEIAIGSAGSRDPSFGNLFGHEIRFYDNGQGGSTSTTVYVAVPGYGAMSHSAPSVPLFTPCKTEFGGGEGSDLGLEPLAAPVVERTIFRVAEIRGRALYDLAGRKVKVTRAGVYFDPVMKDGKIIKRRTVLVTP